MAFTNLSIGVASAFGGILIAIVFLLPSIVMSIISCNYSKLKSKWFKKTYGSVTEGLVIHEVTSREVYQAHYYGVFLMQRFYFAGTLVVFYAWPLAQLILIAVSSLLVRHEAYIIIDDRVLGLDQARVAML